MLTGSCRTFGFLEPFSTEQFNKKKRVLQTCFSTTFSKCNCFTFYNVELLNFLSEFCSYLPVNVAKSKAAAGI